MKQNAYIIQGVIKNKKQKQCDVGLTAYNALDRGNATIDKPIYLKSGHYRTFTNEIDESVYFSYPANAVNLTKELRKMYLDFDFKVIECQMIHKFIPIGTELSTL